MGARPSRPALLALACLAFLPRGCAGESEASGPRARTAEVRTRNQNDPHLHLFVDDEDVERVENLQRVVTSTNFLIDSESRLRGGGMMGMMPGMDMGEMDIPGMDDQKKGGKKGHDHSKMKL